MVTGQWSLGNGHWSLGTGHWALVTGHWSLVTVIPQVIRAGLEQGPAQGYEAESKGFAELGMTSESKALKSLFFGQVSELMCVQCVLASVNTPLY